jgi:hypothetical protein
MVLRKEAHLPGGDAPLYMQRTELACSRSSGILINRRYLHAILYNR